MDKETLIKRMSNLADFIDEVSEYDEGDRWGKATYIIGDKVVELNFIIRDKKKFATSKRDEESIF